MSKNSLGESSGRRGPGESMCSGFGGFFKVRSSLIVDTRGAGLTSVPQNRVISCCNSHRPPVS